MLFSLITSAPNNGEDGERENEVVALIVEHIGAHAIVPLLQVGERRQLEARCRHEIVQASHRWKFYIADLDVRRCM